MITSSSIEHGRPFSVVAIIVLADFAIALWIETGIILSQSFLVIRNAGQDYAPINFTDKLKLLKVMLMSY